MPPAGLEAVHLRHHHVEEDQVGPDLLDHLQRLPAVRGDADLVALRPSGSPPASGCWPACRRRSRMRSASVRRGGGRSAHAGGLPSPAPPARSRGQRLGEGEAARSAPRSAANASSPQERPEHVPIRFEALLGRGIEVGEVPEHLPARPLRRSPGRGRRRRRRRAADAGSGRQTSRARTSTSVAAGPPRSGPSTASAASGGAGRDRLLQLAGGLLHAARARGSRPRPSPCGPAARRRPCRRAASASAISSPARHPAWSDELAQQLQVELPIPADAARPSSVSSPSTDGRPPDGSVRATRRAARDAVTRDGGRRARLAAEAPRRRPVEARDASRTGAPDRSAWTMWSFMPASRQRCRSSIVACAVIAMIGQRGEARVRADLAPSPGSRPSPASAGPSAPRRTAAAAGRRTASRPPRARCWRPSPWRPRLRAARRRSAG